MALREFLLVSPSLGLPQLVFFLRSRELLAQLLYQLLERRNLRRQVRDIDDLRL